MALPASYADYNTWNDSMDATIQAYINGGKSFGTVDEKTGKTVGQTIWTGKDKYGQSHYSITSKDALDKVINNYNTADPTQVQYTRNGGTQYVLQPTYDEKGNITGYNTIQKGLYDLNNVNADNTKAIEDIWKNAKSDTEKAYSGLDEKAKAMYDTANGITNSNFDATANDIYLQYRQNQKKLNEQMSKMGMTGGASETAQIGQLNTYSKNYAGNEGQRNSALQGNLQEYNANLYKNAQSLADALVGVARDKAGALNTNAENNASSLRDYYSERRNISDTAERDRKQQNYSLEQIKAQAKASADADLKVYKAKQKYDAKVISKNKSKVSDQNARTKKAIKELQKKGKTVYVWYETNSYGNMVLRKSTSQGDASARASAAGTTAYPYGSGISLSTKESIYATKATQK